MVSEFHLKCPKCVNEFDFEYDQLNSFSDPNVPGITWREGTHRFAVKCHSCGKRFHYHMGDDGKKLSDWWVSAHCLPDQSGDLCIHRLIQ